MYAYLLFTAISVFVLLPCSIFLIVISMQLYYFLIPTAATYGE